MAIINCAARIPWGARIRPLFDDVVVDTTASYGRGMRAAPGGHALPFALCPLYRMKVAPSATPSGPSPLASPSSRLSMVVLRKG